MNNLFDKCRFSLFFSRTKQLLWIIHYSDLTNFYNQKITVKLIDIDNFPGNIYLDKFETGV